MDSACPLSVQATTRQTTSIFSLVAVRIGTFSIFLIEPRDCQEWQAAPGLTVLISEPPRSGSDSTRSVEGRPVLRGLLVDLDVLQVDVDMSEFVFEFGADHLKDVPVTLFIERTRE
jgi:hypothetical protein